ncbi:MAG: hypothetical protein ABEH88_08160 [Halobacteriales archaeon]
MIGDESPWLMNLIITISLLPILIGTLGEHVGTETMLLSICLLFLVVTLYTLIEGQIVDPPRPKNIDGELIAGATHENPLAVHQSEGGKGASEEEDER